MTDKKRPIFTIIDDIVSEEPHSSDELMAWAGRLNEKGDLAHAAVSLPWSEDCNTHIYFTHLCGEETLSERD